MVTGEIGSGKTHILRHLAGTDAAGWESDNLSESNGIERIKKIRLKKGEVTYLNSGDWVENLTSLEFSNNKWNLFRYNDREFMKNQDKYMHKNNITFYLEWIKKGGFS